MKKLLVSLHDSAHRTFLAQFGFQVEDSSFSKFVDYLHAPKDSSSLAVTRILFGLAMLFDIPDERGGSTMEKRWGDPKSCHFPLLPFVQPLPLPYMAAVYAGLWFGALGIMLGYKYRCSAVTFTLCYWYLYIIEKSFWNNHSYLFGLVALLLSFTDAACYWSLDSYKDPSKRSTTVPYWNYFTLKYQFFILYFMAGVKKCTAEWLTGYSVLNLSEHWVFAPFRLFLTVEQTDYLIVHWFVFLFDLTVALWMMCSNTRHVAMIFCAMFHLMNTRLFMIGMFPWVCLATMPLFYPFDWPKTLPRNLLNIKAKVCQKLSKLGQSINKQKQLDQIDPISNDNSDKGNSDSIENTNVHETENSKNNGNDDAKHLSELDSEKVKDLDDCVEKEVTELTEVNGKGTGDVESISTCKQRLTVYLILFHVLSQAFLPFSHFITQGYNNWTDGLYGYSWDMMVHSWDTHAVIVQVVDNVNHRHFYVDPHTYTPNDRWTRHGDMVYQYARCLRDRLEEARKSEATEPYCHGLKGEAVDVKEDSQNPKFKLENSGKKVENSKTGLSSNLSIYIDVWCSMNGRFVQRLFDPHMDLLKAKWGPFDKVPYLMPLLDEGLEWRADLVRMSQEVHSWSNYSDVVFLADFPGYVQEKYISENLTNVTLTILKGIAAYHPEVSNGQSVLMHDGDRIPVQSRLFHKVLNIGKEPVFYMYTYNSIEVEKPARVTAKLPVLSELYDRIVKILAFLYKMLRFLVLIFFSACYS